MCIILRLRTFINYKYKQEAKNLGEYASLTTFQRI